MISFRPAFLLLVPLASAPPARAQDDMVPRELALALLTTWAPDSLPVDMLVGRLPEWVPVDVLHPGARLLGTITFGRNALVVQRSVNPPAQVLEAAAARLASAGWRRVHQRGQGEMSFGPPPEHYCDATGNEMALLARPLPGGGSDVHTAVEAGDGRSTCGEDAALERFARGLEVPDVQPPDGSRMVAGTGGGGEDDYSMTYRIVGAAGPEVLLAHYADGLLRAGWTLGQRTSSALMTAQMVEAPGTDGSRWAGLLAAYAVPSGAHEVSIRVFRVMAP